MFEEQQKDITAYFLQFTADSKQDFLQIQFAVLPACTTTSLAQMLLHFASFSIQLNEMEPLWNLWQDVSLEGKQKFAQVSVVQTAKI